MKTICIEVKDDMFSKEDEKAYNKAIRELQEGEAINLDQAKQELLCV